MSLRKSQNILIALAAILLIQSCKLSEKYETPEIGVSENFRDVTSEDSLSMASYSWDQIITDTTLQSLIVKGLQNNLNLLSAIENIRQAEASLNVAKLGLVPSLEATGQVTRSRTSQAALNLPPSVNINLNTTTYQAQLSSSWELDVWGKLRSSKRAALANLLSTEAATRAVQTQLIADIATAYYSLLGLDAQLAIAEQTLALRKEDQETMRMLKESAIVDGAAVVQSEASRYEVEISIPEIELSIVQQENALAILLGRNIGTIERGSLEEQQAFADLEVGVPATLLANRPDIQQAEFAMRNAFENVKVARANFYPALTLTASGGLSSLEMEDFFRNSIFHSLVGGLTQPIFSRGENKARLKTNQSLQQQAFYNYRQSWLSASQEISNSLLSYQKSKQKQAARELQIEALEKSVEFTKSLLEYSSSTNYTDVLTSQNNLLTAQLSSVSDKLQELQAIVQLYRALGGGWELTEE